MNIIEITYIITGLLAIVAMLPQIKQLLKTKLSDELSITTWVIWTGYQMSALVYGISVHMLALILVSFVSLPLYMTVLALIVKYRNNSSALVYQPITYSENKLPEVAHAYTMKHRS